MTLTNAPRLLLLGLAGLVILVIAGFGVSRAVAGERVLGRVSAMGAELDGMDRSEVEVALASAEVSLQGRPVSFDVMGDVAPLLPAQVGFDVDVKAMADIAMGLGREGNLSMQFRWWLSHLGEREVLAPLATVDESLIEQVLQTWDDQYIGNPPFPGDIEIEGTTAVPSYPKQGQQIDRSLAIPIVRETLVSVDAPESPVSLPAIEVSPEVDAAAVDAAVERANLWLSSPITLVSENGEAQVGFSVEHLAAAFRSEPDDGFVRLFFDPATVENHLDAIRAEIEEEPVDARFDIIDGTRVRVIPGQQGTEIDPQTTADNLAVAAGGSIRRGVLPLAVGADPEVTTEALEALGITHLIFQFTTYHACCQNRVANIHLMADAVDGSVLGPGETFSLNETVGQRTEEKGYLEDGTIIRGELTETVGGGVSQFATTMYNAVFWGGLEDVTHKPHSFYFPRYPRGIEATISWPQPDLSFRNDTEAGILIDTTFSDTSITVRLFGDNDGRILAADWADPGPYDFELLAEGGPRARNVSGSVSDRINFRDPPEPQFRGVSELDVDSSRTVQTAAEGYSVIVTRTITVGDQESIEEWTVVYSPRREIIEVHPCKVPGTSVECPAPPTTTAVAPDTTVPPETTAPTSLLTLRRPTLSRPERTDSPAPLESSQDPDSEVIPEELRDDGGGPGAVEIRPTPRATN